MRIEPGSLKPCSTELTPECSEYISRLRRQENASPADFATNLEKLTEWSSVLGKTEMSRWANVLNDCDAILEQATMLQANGAPAIDNDGALERPVMAILKFTCLLFESTFSRSVYRSMERLQTLLESRKMHVVVQTLRLLLVISKSSRYITHHVADIDRRPLQMRLIANTEESWNAAGKWKLKMIDLCVDGALPDSETHMAEMRTISFRTAAGTSQQFIVGEGASYEEAKGELRKRLDEPGDVEESEKVLAMTKLRLAYNFNSLDLRLHCIMARLISISVLFYSRCLLDEWRINCLVGDSMIEQICALLQLPSGDATNAALIDTLKTEALKTLASVVFLEKQTKIQLIVDCLGLNSYHGSTPALVRSCVEKLRSGAVEPEGGGDYDGSGPSVNFITSLFSLVYHLAGFEAGGSALTRSSMVATLLGVVKAYSLPDSQISFVTRAVRIIDILTGIEVQEFNTNDGMSAIVDRFVHEVDVCKKHIEKEEELRASSDGRAAPLVVCHQQRSALMKSLMNFLKRAVSDTNYAAQIRRIMECELPTALAHLVQNSQYYGASLLHCAIHLTTSFIYQEPAQLTHLQDKGLTDALLDSILLNEKFPISRDIVNALPNICSALCLNERGLKAFNEKQPLERIFRIIFSTKFLASMRKRKTEIRKFLANANVCGRKSPRIRLEECATSLGSTFDELMRHQPTLRKDLISALVKVVDDILATGMKSTQPDSSSSTAPAPVRIVWTVGKNAPEESFDVEGGEKKPPVAQVSPPSTFQFYFQAADGTQILPLADYAVMLGYLVDFILNNRAAQENSNLMVEAGMQSRLVDFLDFPRPYSTVQQWHYLQSVSNILRHLLSQTNKTEAFEPLIGKLTLQLQLYSRASTVQEVHTRERLYLLNRIGPMVAVLHNYLLKATGVNNVHDTRALLLSYFTGNETGKEFINQLFECYADMNWDMLLVASAGGATDTSAPPPPISTPSQTPSAGHPSSSSSVSTPMDAASASVDVAQPPALTASNNAKRSTSGESSLERNINASTTKIQKHIGELIYLLGKTFCFTAINRLRRGVGLLDPTQCKSVQRQMAETLFVGMGRLMVIDEENLRGNGSGVHIANVLGLLRRLLFDDVQGHHFMRPFFLKSHCHRAFFALGEWLIDNMAREELAAGLASWLSMVPRLVSASSVVQQPRARMEQRSVVEGFDWKKYLSVTHRDALHTLVQLFKSATASTESERRGEGAKVMVEKVLMALQALVRGMIQINETEKKANAEPDLDVLLREIDMDKVQRLVEMGFSQSDAVDALLVHNSVPEAAEYLMDRQGQASTAVSASSTSSTAAVRSAQVITFNSTDALSTAAITTEAVTTALTAPIEPTITLREVLHDSTLESIDGVPIQQQSLQSLEPSSSSTAVSQATPASAEPSTIQGESTQPPVIQPPLDVSTPATDEPPTTAGSSAEAMDTSEPSEHEPPVNPSATAATSSSQPLSQPVTAAVSQPSSSKALAPSSADDFSQTLEELREAKSVDFKEAIEQICSRVVPHCLALGHDETLVYAIAELIYVFVCDPVALALVEKTLIDGLITDLHAGLNGLLQSPKEGESRFRSLLHLFCLLWQGFETTKLYSKLPPTFYPSIVELLVKLADEENSLESRLIPHLVLFIDMYEKERRLDHRQQLFNTCVDHIQWCYHVNEQRYDSPAEWRDYPAICSAQLNQAFRDGKAVVKITMSEKNYLVNFVDMTQRIINTGDVPALVRAVPVFAKAKLSSNFQLEKVLESEQTLNNASEQHKQLAVVVTRLLQQPSKSNTPLSSQTAYSLLSLLLRLLSLRGTVSDFIRNDGIATLLRLESKERMFIMSRIVVLIARLCADDANEDGRASFEKIVQSAVSSSIVPFSLTEPSSQARGWMQRTRRQQREWKAMMRMFAPLATRAPKLHVETIKKTVCLRNDEMALESTSAAGQVERVQDATESQDTLKLKIVDKIVDELLHTNWAKAKSRVLGPPELLKLLAELVRSYPSTSAQLVEAVHEKRPLAHWIIDRFLLQNGVPGDTTAMEDMVDVSLSAKALLSNMISCFDQSNAKANEVLVGEVKSLLHSTINTHQQRRGKQASVAESKEAVQQLCNKVTSLAKLLMLLRESASNVSTPSADNPQRREMPKQYALIKQIHKKGLVVDFTKALWHLPLREKVAAETTNSVLRMLETIARDLCHITAVTRAAAAASATNTPNATSSATPTATPASSSSVPVPAPSFAEGTVNAVTPLVGGVEIVDSSVAPSTPAPVTNSVAAELTGDEPVPQEETGSAEQAQQEDDVEMAEFNEHVSEAISTINSATRGDLPSAVSEGAFDRVDEDMGVPPAAEEAQHSQSASTPRYEIYADDHDAMGNDHAHHSDHEDHADAYSSASSPSSSSSDEGSAGEGVGGGDGMNAPEHVSDEDDTVSEEDDEGDGVNDAHMEIEVEIGAGAVDGDAAVPIRSRHPAGDVHTVHDPIRIDQVRMEEDDEEEEDDGAEEDDEAMEADSRVITRVVNPHHHHNVAHDEHGDPEDEVDEDDEEDGDEEDGEEDDDEGEDGMDYDEDEAEMDLEEVLDSLGADQLVSELQRRTGRHASAHLGNLAGYVSGLLGRLPGGASAVLEAAAADGRHRHRLFTLSHNNRDGPSTTASFSVGIPLDRYRFSAAASAAMGGPPTGISRGDGAMSEHPLLRRPLPPISIPLPGATGGGDSSHSPSNDNAQQQLAAADQAAVHLANSNYPMSLMEFLQNDEAIQRIVAAHTGRVHRPAAVHAGLRRQGALRRWHPVAVPADPHNPNAPHGVHANRVTHRILARIMDEGYDQLYGGNRDAAAAGYSDAEGLEASTDRRLTDSLIPYYYDRVADHVRLVDAQSAHYLSILLSSYLTNEAKEKERRVAEEEAKKKQEAEETRKKVAEEARKKAEEEARKAAEEASTMGAAAAVVAETQQTANACDAAAAGVEIEGEQSAATSAEPSSALAPIPPTSNSSGGENGEEDERHSAGESVDSSELSNRFAVLPTSSAAEDESTRDSGRDADIEQPPVVQQAEEDPVTPQAQVSAMEVEVEQQPIVEENPTQLVTQPQQSTAEEGSTEAAPVGSGEGTGEPSTAEDYRAILGNIEIPEGVDPAFLAALPEEIRQEVIRDHMRQQRAQRLVQAQRAASTQSASEGTQSTNPQPDNITPQQLETPQEVSAAPVQGDPQQQPAQPAAVSNEEEDVLDQEFLNALPPELQEEVLREHEQRINQRNRQAAAAAAASGSAAAAPAAAPTAADHAADAAALFESLPPGLRAQVLADMDDSIVAYLPPNLQAEANRLRANLHHQQAFRIAMGGGGGGEHRGGGGNRFGGTATATRGGGASRFYDGQMYAQPGAAQLGDVERGVQMLDREAIATVLLVYFFDQERFNHTRLQKLLKVICLHSGTCDYVVWSLLSILHGLNNDKGGDEPNDASAATGWVDTQFLVQTPLNHSERIIRFMASGEVSIHPLVKQSICTRVLDVLGQVMARNFPQHFLPDKIRLAPNSTKRWDSPPEIAHFWTTVKSINKKSCEESKPVSTKSTLQGMKDMIAGSLEKSPLAHLLTLPSSTLIRQNGTLMDKSVKILQTIAQSIPNGSQAKVPDESIHWLMQRIKGVASLMLESCTEGDGLEGVKGFLFEVLRMLPEHRATLFSILYTIVEEQGARLHCDLLALSDELKELKPNLSVGSTTEAAGAPSTSSASDAPPAAHQLSTLKDFTARNSRAKRLLRSVEVISYLRNKQRQLDQQRKRALAAAAAAASKDKEKGGMAAQPPSASIAQQQDAMNEAADVGNLERMLGSMESLWNSLSACLEEMSRKLDSHAVLSLQHAAEAFFLAHALCIPASSSGNGAESNVGGGGGETAAPPAIQAASSESKPAEAAEPVEEPQPSTSAASRPIPRLDHEKYRQSMFTFAEKHRSVLNQILRGNANNLMEDSAMHILTYFPKLLDFDVKRKYFIKEIRRMDSRDRYHREDVAVRIRRAHLFSDSFRELFRLRGADWKQRFYIIFEGEEGQDAGGLLREWYSVITREVFNPMYALFVTSPGDRVTYMINPASYINPEHLDYFKFIGRVIAKAIFDNKQLDCYFTRAFYKHILNVSVRYQDIESEDPSYFKSLEFLLGNPLEIIGSEMTFTVEVEEFGERSIRDLKEGGSKIAVTDENKDEYVQLVCQMKMTGSIRKQLDAFLSGFYDIIPKRLISIFNEQELELLISGLPEIDIDDLCANTEYKGFTRSSTQIQWFWRALRSYEKEDLAKFLQFVTGTSKVPLQGFSQLEGMNGVQKFTIHMDSRSNDRLPSAHTCFNQLDLPCYDSYEQLRRMMLLAIRECSEGFAFA